MPNPFRPITSADECPPGTTVVYGHQRCADGVYRIDDAKSATVARITPTGQITLSDGARFHRGKYNTSFVGIGGTSGYLYAATSEALAEADRCEAVRAENERRESERHARIAASERIRALAYSHRSNPGRANNIGIALAVLEAAPLTEEQHAAILALLAPATTETAP